MSTHQVPVIRIEQLERHPNADKLEIIKWKGFTFCVKKGQFKLGDLAVLIESDYEVPLVRPEFVFLAPKDKKTDYAKVRVTKMRGITSHGLLIPAPDGTKEGDDLLNYYGIRRYEPPIQITTKGESEKAPSIYAPVYDVENLRKYNDIFKVGELIIVREKIHGCSSRFFYAEGRMFCSSRSEWKKQSEGNIVWQCLRQNPWIEEFCKSHQGLVLYGEIFGWVQDLRYGARKGQLFFKAFDLLRGSEWLSYNEALSVLPEGTNAPQERGWCPFVYTGEYKSLNEIENLTRGNSLIVGANHIREGVVIRPVVERTALDLGRVQLKLVSSEYLKS